jgi:hypothetical protein
VIKMDLPKKKKKNSPLIPQKKKKIKIPFNDLASLPSEEEFGNEYH